MSSIKGQLRFFVYRKLTFFFFEIANFIKKPDRCSRRTETGDSETTS